MKNKKTALFVLALSAAVVILLACYFSVGGERLSAPLTQLREGNVIRIVKSREPSEKSEIVQTADCGEAQEDMLIALIESTKFTRIVSRIVPFTDTDRYLITVEAPNGNTLFRLESYGGEFLIADYSPGDAPVKHYKLKIRNPEWKPALEEILSAA